MQPRPDGPADPRGDQAGVDYYVPAKIEAAPGGSPARRVPAAEPADPRGDQAGRGYYRAVQIDAAEFCRANDLGPMEYRIIDRVARHAHRGGRVDLEDARAVVDRLIALRYPAADPARRPTRVGDLYYDPTVRATFRVARSEANVVELVPRDCAGGTPRQSSSLGYIERNMDRVEVGPGPPASDAAYQFLGGRVPIRVRIVGRAPGSVIAQMVNGRDEGVVRKFDDDFFDEFFKPAEPPAEDLLAAMIDLAAAAAEPAPPAVVVGSVWARKDHPEIEYRVCGVSGPGGLVSIEGVSRVGLELVADGPTYPIGEAILRQLYTPVGPAAVAPAPAPAPAAGDALRAPAVARLSCRRCERDGTAGSPVIFADGICRDCHQASDPRPGMRLIEHGKGTAYRVDSVDPRRGVAVIVAVDPRGGQAATADLDDIADGFRVDPDLPGLDAEVPIGVGSRWQRSLGFLDSPHLQVVGFRGRDPLVRLDTDAFDQADRRLSRDYLLRCYKPEADAHA